MDWSTVIQYLLVGLAAGASAIAAAYAKSNNGKILLPAARSSPLALIERVPVGHGNAPNAGHSEIAATILPWMPASYIPAWSQNAGVLPDGVIDPEHWNDCGECCVSMCVAGVWGVPIEPGAIRQYLHGPLGTGLTDGAALQRALHYCSVKSHVVSMSGNDAFNLILDAVSAQHPVIMLGHWEGIGTALHWMIAVSDGADVLQYVDPWDGARAYITRSHWLQMESGSLVVLDAHLHFDCRTWPQPS